MGFTGSKQQNMWVECACWLFIRTNKPQAIIFLSSPVDTIYSMGCVWLGGPYVMQILMKLDMMLQNLSCFLPWVPFLLLTLISIYYFLGTKHHRRKTTNICQLAVSPPRCPHQSASSSFFSASETSELKSTLTGSQNQQSFTAVRFKNTTSTGSQE